MTSGGEVTAGDPAAAQGASLPVVKILMASYNGAQWISQQLDSIEQQDGVLIDLTVSDDCSQDDTAAILSERSERCARMTWFSTARPSGSAAANFRSLFLQEIPVGTDYVALCDQDDLWSPGKLAAAVAALRASGAQGYSCAVEAFWPDGRTQVLAQTSRPRAADFLFEGSGQGCTFVLDAKLFVRVQGFCREHADTVARLHYHDWLLYLLARTWNCAWEFDPQPWLRYRQHANNEIGARSGVTAWLRRLTLIRNGWYLRQLQAASEIYVLGGGSDKRVLRIASVLGHQDKLLPWQRFRMCALAIRFGRRRTIDRLVVAISALAGWL